MTRQVRIARLGAQGDGVIDTPDGPAYVPFALPGELIEVEGSESRPTLAKIAESSPGRAEPECRHFGRCGGCALQHLAEEPYLDWKRQKVAMALSQAGIGIEPEATVACTPRTRRRALFSARNTAGGALLGFNEFATHSIVNIEECPVLVPQIVDALPRIRALAGFFSSSRKPLRVSVTATDHGLDVDVSETGPVSDRLRRDISQFALAQRFARISLGGDIVVEPMKPELGFDGVAVVPPPGGFLQATAGAESAMAELVCGHLAGAKRIADLFAGCGTFALRLARKSTVHAVEQESAALHALDRAFRFADGLKTVTTERRDLFRRPLTPAELKRFDGLVFDPPRAGAEAQARAIARSGVPRVAAVSCNPATLARDLSILVEGGYRIINVTPIDQFLWSPHVEVVALLEKPHKRR